MQNLDEVLEKGGRGCKHRLLEGDLKKQWSGQGALGEEKALGVAALLNHLQASQM